MGVAGSNTRRSGAPLGLSLARVARRAALCRGPRGVLVDLAEGLEDLAERVHCLVDVRLTKNHRRLHHQHVFVWAVARGEDEELVLQPRADHAAFGGRGRTRYAVLDKIDTNEEPLATHVADDLVLSGKIAQPPAHVLAHARRMRLEALALHEVEHSDARRAYDRVAAEGVEILQPVMERVGDLGGRHHRGQRHPVTEGLAHGDNVGHHVLLLEAPEARAHATEAHLDLIRNAHAACGTHGLVALLEVASRRQDHTGDRHAGLNKKRRDAAARASSAVLDLLASVGNLLRVLRPGLGIVLPVGATKGVGRVHHVDPRLLALPALVVELVRRDIDHLVRVAMVGVLHADDLLVVRLGARQAEGQVVGLTARVYEEDTVQRSGAFGEQLLSQHHMVGVEVPHVRVESGGLRRDGLHHCGARVPAVPHVVTRIEERAATLVVQPGALSPNDEQRVDVRVRDRLRRAELRLAEAVDASFCQGLADGVHVAGGGRCCLLQSAIEGRASRPPFRHPHDRRHGCSRCGREDGGHWHPAVAGAPRRHGKPSVDSAPGRLARVLLSNQGCPKNTLGDTMPKVSPWPKSS
mmetsp:Transcript_10556/g.27972  ORF Transcript_10556/g.27972 Transcript_10556/m.27972 type:complete len:580 (-) Transcript_10556:69-1808(-)